MIQTIVENYVKKQQNATDEFLEIPKIIHQTWKDENIPEEWRGFQENVKKTFWDCEYKLWTDKDNRELIEKKFSWFLPIYDGYEKNIERADAIRYFILYEYGGIYMDLDYSVRKNFYDNLDLKKVNIVESYRNKGFLSNFLMASPPQHFVWRKVFDALVINRNCKYTLNSTGPNMLSGVLLSENINILPFQFYNPPNPNICTAYKYCSLNILKNQYDFSLWYKSYGNHHNSETWRNDEIIVFLKRNLYIIIPIGFLCFYKIFI